MIDVPAPHAPPFPLGEGREPILVHEGELELRYPDATIGSRGRIELVLLPTPRFRFSLENAPAAPAPGAADGLTVLGFPGRLDAFVTNTHLGGSALVTGSTDGSIGDGDSACLTEVSFLVTNLPFFFGDPLHQGRPLGDGGSGETYWRGRLALAAVGWAFDLDLRVEHRLIYARLDEHGGFEVTHVGSLRREDGGSFSGRQAAEMLDTLGGFLGLVCGAWAPPIAAAGLADNGPLVWLELKRRWASPWLPRLRSFDLQKHELGDAFAVYVACRNDPIWNESLPIAVQMYVEANSPITADTSLVLAQSVLELIAWVRFVDELGTRQASDFDGLRASDRLRELIAWLHIDAAIPPQQVALAAEAASQGWTDGPHAIGEMRNALIHPRQRERLRTSMKSRIELQELALWYVELALLHLVDFQGSYANRLGAKVSGIVEPVPWS